MVFYLSYYYSLYRSFLLLNVWSRTDGSREMLPDAGIETTIRMLFGIILHLMTSICSNGRHGSLCFVLFVHFPFLVGPRMHSIKFSVVLFRSRLRNTPGDCKRSRRPFVRVAVSYGYRCRCFRVVLSGFWFLPTQ